MKIVAEVIGVARSNLIERLQERPKRRIGRPPVPDDDLVAAIKVVIAERPTYGYRRVHAILKRQALTEGRQPPNHKRIYRVMKVHGLLLDRNSGGAERHAISIKRASRSQVVLSNSLFFFFSESLFLGATSSSPPSSSSSTLPHSASTSSRGFLIFSKSWNKPSPN
jgi:hypothetical protein